MKDTIITKSYFCAERRCFLGTGRVPVHDEKTFVLLKFPLRPSIGVFLIGFTTVLLSLLSLETFAVAFGIPI